MADKKHVDDTEPVNIGALAIDCTNLASFVIDLPPGALLGMRSEQEGYEEVVNEILSNQPDLGDQAGVTEGDIEALMLANERIELLDAKLPAARKLVEILEETRGKLDDQRQRLVSAIAKAVEMRAKAFGDDELLAKYEKTRTYRSAIGVKAAKTRRKNALAAVDANAAAVDADDGEMADAAVA